MKYQASWDLSTIPDDQWASEHGRRNRAKAPRATNVNLKPCPSCGTKLTARQRRQPCIKCGVRNDPRAKGRA